MCLQYVASTESKIVLVSQYYFGYGNIHIIFHVFMSALYHQAHPVHLTLQEKAMDKNGPMMEW